MNCKSAIIYACENGATTIKYQKFNLKRLNLNTIKFRRIKVNNRFNIFRQLRHGRGDGFLDPSKFEAGVWRSAQSPRAPWVQNVPETCGRPAADRRQLGRRRRAAGGRRCHRKVHARGRPRPRQPEDSHGSPPKARACPTKPGPFVYLAPTILSATRAVSCSPLNPGIFQRIDESYRFCAHFYLFDSNHLLVLTFDVCFFHIFCTLGV